MFKITKSNKSTQGRDRPKEAKQILDEQLETSLREFNRSNTGLFMSALTAGLEIGFSVLTMGTVLTMFKDSVDAQTLHFYLSLCYSIGFIFVIIGRSELFTEHTALAFLPVLKGSVNVKDLFELWGLVYFGNLVGGYVFGSLIVQIGPQAGFIKPEAFAYLSHELISYDWNTILLSAILAGWMMGLLGWLVTSSQDTMSRIFVIILVTSTIGLAGLHHCIVGSIEVFVGWMSSDDIMFTDYLKFQTWATLGNVVGGSVFVAVLKYSNVRIK